MYTEVFLIFTHNHWWVVLLTCAELSSCGRSEDGEQGEDSVQQSTRVSHEQLLPSHIQSRAKDFRGWQTAPANHKQGQQCAQQSSGHTTETTLLKNSQESGKSRWFPFVILRINAEYLESVGELQLLWLIICADGLLSASEYQLTFLHQWDPTLGLKASILTF